MFWKVLQKGAQLHYAFMKDTYELLKLNSNGITVIPSIIFIAFSFILCYSIFHRRTRYHTPLKLLIRKEIAFQWTYFYVIRMWLFFVKSSRYGIAWLEELLKMTHYENKMLWLSSLQLQAGCFSLITTISTAPLTIFILNYLWKQNIPNFLMWVGEDPWIRSEIGISGHYLDRPVRFRLPKRQDYSYRSRRSSSVDYMLNPSTLSIVRNCKSLQNVSRDLNNNTILL